MLKVWWDISWWLYCKFITESANERILKIGQHLAKLQTKV